MWNTLVLLVLYTPILYRIHRRLAQLESKVDQLSTQLNQEKVTVLHRRDRE